MIGIERAIINRWNAMGLNSVVTGGISHVHVPEFTNLPICAMEVLASTKIGQSVASRYGERQVQFTIWHSNDDLLDIISGQVRDAFMNAERALTSPMQVASVPGSKIFRVDCTQDPVIIQESDFVWSATMVFAIWFAEDGALTPA